LRAPEARQSTAPLSVIASAAGARQSTASALVIASAAGARQSTYRANHGLLRRFAPRNDDAVKQPAVYIMASKKNGTLYTGVTSDLVKRVWQHRTGVGDGFTKRYGCKSLVWYEVGDDISGAIMREKQIKAGSRAKKLALIQSTNPDWRDLWPEIAQP
jgi:putative endonuclease